MRCEWLFSFFCCPIYYFVWSQLRGSRQYNTAGCLAQWLVCLPVTALIPRIGLCKQCRPWSDCSSEQSDQGLHYLPRPICLKGSLWYWGNGWWTGVSLNVAVASPSYHNQTVKFRPSPCHQIYITSHLVVPQWVTLLNPRGCKTVQTYRHPTLLPNNMTKKQQSCIFLETYSKVYLTAKLDITLSLLHPHALFDLRCFRKRIIVNVAQWSHIVYKWSTIFILINAPGRRCRSKVYKGHPWDKNLGKNKIFW